MKSQTVFKAFAALMIAMLVFSALPARPAAAATNPSIVVNGDFEAGNLGFTSNYTYVAPAPNALVPEGLYTITTNPHNVHSGFNSRTDHTSGSGNMFVGNGDANTSKIVWQGSINQDLVVGQTYDFSAYVLNADGGENAKLTFKAGGVTIGTIEVTSTNWVRLYGSFVADAIRPTLYLTNAQSAAGGNDFAIDDINIYAQGTHTPPSAGSTASTTVVTDSVDPAVVGGSVTYTATVTSGAVPLAGNVDWYQGDTYLGTSALNGAGQATYTTSWGSIGTKRIQGEYQGNGTYAVSYDWEDTDVITCSAPTVGSINPTSGTTLGGTNVIITGTGFQQGSCPITGVTFGGTGALSYTVDGPTQITASTPAKTTGPGAVPVVVTNSVGSGTYNSYTYVCPTPTITSVNPNTDDLAGGNTVTITGTHFNDAGCAVTSVQFDNPVDVPAPKAAGITGNTGTTLTVLAPSAPYPAGAPGAPADGTYPAGGGQQVDVIVNAPGGTATKPLGYVYVPAPTVTDVDRATQSTPGTTDYDNNAGPVAGGQVVQIFGTNFKSSYATGANWTTTNVMFGGAGVMASCTVNSATQLTCTTPNNPYPASTPPYVVDVRVVTPGGDETIGNDLYLYVPPPTITHLSLDVGPTTGGSPVVITGTNFMTSPLASYGAHGLTWTTDALQFGGTDAAAYTVDTATQISSTTPPHLAGQVNVNATTPGGTNGNDANNQFNYVQQSYFAVEPNYGSTLGGTTVILNGVGFTGTTAVTFGTTPATCTVNSDTQITCTTPAHSAGLVEIVLTGGPSGERHYPDSFTYVPPADGVQPNAGPTSGGTTVTITGVGFDGTTTVTFGGSTAACTLTDATHLSCITPPHAGGTFDVVVAGPGATTFVNGFTFVPPSAYADIYPNYGPIAGGTTVTIHGTGFAGATFVKFGLTNAASFTVDSNTQITAVTPGHVAGTVNVVVTTPSGDVTYVNGFTFTGTDLPLAPFSVPANGSETTGTGPNQLQVTFDEQVMHGTQLGDPTNWPFSAMNPANYMLVEAGANGVFDTLTCWGGVVVDDINVPINSVASYNDVTFNATLNVNNGFSLYYGYYRLFACGTTSIKNPAGVKLNGGLDDTRYTFRFVPATPLAAAEAPAALPATGFAPGMMTVLPAQPAEKAYTALGDLWLEIPRLGVQIPIFGVPASEDGWDVSWLGRDAGWLAGTAFPTWAGNSVLTAHVVDVNGNDGPFAHLNWMWYGDQIIVHAFGQQYIYEVRAVKLVSPDNSYWVTKHEELPWLTLVTCKGYDAATDTYKYRVVVRAVQVAIQ